MYKSRKGAVCVGGGGGGIVLVADLNLLWLSCSDIGHSPCSFLQVRYIR